MKNILIITLYGFVVGMAGTGLGGLASLFVKSSNKVLSFFIRTNWWIYDVYSYISSITRIFSIRWAL